MGTSSVYPVAKLETAINFANKTDLIEGELTRIHLIGWGAEPHQPPSRATSYGDILPTLMLRIESGLLASQSGYCLGLHELYLGSTG